MNVIATYPPDESTKIYLDDTIVVRFDEEIEGSYLTDAYFLFYKTDAQRQTYYYQIQKSITQNGTEVLIKPTVLEADSYYSLIIVGGNSGIRSTTGSTLPSNVIVPVTVGAALSPSTPVITTISGEIITNIIDGDTYTYGSDVTRPSYDVFATPSESQYTRILSSVPSNNAIGVSAFDTISLVCNGVVVDNSLPRSAVSVSYAVLPFDPDPFVNHNLDFEVRYSGEVVALEFGHLIDTANREFAVTVSPGFLKVNGKYPENEGFSLNFLGQLSPMFVTPQAVKAKLSAFVGTDIPVSLYEISKMVLEKSSLLLALRDGTPVPVELLPVAAEYITCLIIRDLVVFRGALVGRLKSRELLATQVVYENVPFKDLKSLVDECIEASSSTLDVEDVTVTEIKSRIWMNRETKKYGIYR